jgi:hypothetical protein
VKNQTICQKLIASMFQLGCTEEMFANFSQDVALQRLLISFLAANVGQEPLEIERIDDVRHSIYRTKFSPLRFEVSDWKSFLTARNSRVDKRGQCEFSPDFFSPENFDSPISSSMPSIILIDSKQGELAVEDAGAVINKHVPGSYVATRTWLILEVLRKFWSHLNELNAAYIVVGKRSPNSLYPVLFNHPTVGKKLSFERAIPRNVKGHGYLAFCGTTA